MVALFCHAIYPTRKSGPIKSTLAVKAGRTDNLKKLSTLNFMRLGPSYISKKYPGMAPIDKKRKSAPTNDSFARSRNPSIKDAVTRPSKRAKPDEEGKERKSTAGPTKLYHARDEEVAFPRGGASVLTPLEHKQIQIEATRDVLFEQGAKTDGEVDAVTSARKISKSKGKNKKSSEQPQEEEDSVKIEGLSYKVFITFSAFNLDLTLNSDWFQAPSSSAKYPKSMITILLFLCRTT
jgi:hypothetical protein